MLGGIYKNFPGLFDQPAESEDDPGREEEGDRGENGSFTRFDIFPLVLDYCKETNETLTTALNESVVQVFFICDYINEKRIEERKQLNKIYKKN
jgi:hypothetical protein